MLLSDGTGEAESDSHAEATGLGGEEGIHQVFAGLFVDSQPAIDDIDADAFALTGGVDFHPSDGTMAFDDSIEGVV